jgi:hypothetical protein
LKPRYADRFETGIAIEALPKLRAASLMLDEVLNRQPNRQAAYVGSAAFAHKAGLHASAIAKNPATYEHVEPHSVGNARVIPMSNQAGRSNLVKRLAEAGIEVDAGDKRLGRLLTHVKEREDQGFAFDSAQASFELLARRFLGQVPKFFEVDRYRVSVERRDDPHDGIVTVSEAVVVVYVDGERMISASESVDPVTNADQGPVNALARALRKDLGKYQSYIEDLHLVDFKVRIIGAGTEAVTRVLIDSADSQGNTWSTVGVSPNIRGIAQHRRRLVPGAGGCGDHQADPGGGACREMSGPPLSACATLVRQLDPDLFHAALFAPEPARERLMVLYAYDIELSKAAARASEPLIAQMRLQWWRDLVAGIQAGEPPSQHEVAGPLYGLLGDHPLPAADLALLIDAREIELQGPMDADRFGAWVDGRFGALTRLAAHLLAGENPAARQAATAVGHAMGVAFAMRHAVTLAAEANLYLLPGLAPEGRAELARGRHASARHRPSAGRAGAGAVGCGEGRARQRAKGSGSRSAAGVAGGTGVEAGAAAGFRLAG